MRKTFQSWVLPGLALAILLAAHALANDVHSSRHGRGTIALNPVVRRLGTNCSLAVSLLMILGVRGPEGTNFIKEKRK